MKWDRWPWTEAPAETRGAFSAVVEAALLAHAQGSTADPQALAVVIASSNYLGNVISESRVVTPAGDPRAAAITPAWLMSCGQRLVLRGEAVDWMVVRNGVAELIPSAEHEVTAGKLDRAAWQYRLTFDRPTREGGALSVQAGADATFHVRLGSLYTSGSAGLSGALRGSQTAAAAAHLERSIRDASAGPTGTLMPVPGNVGEEDSGKLRSEYAALAAQISKLGGKVALIESSRSGHDRAGVAGNTEKPIVLGAKFDDNTAAIRGQLESSIAAALSTAPALLGLGAAPASERRELQRQIRVERRSSGRWAHCGRAVASASVPMSEAGRRRPNSPADLVSRARAFGSLVKAGVSIEKRGVGDWIFQTWHRQRRERRE